MCCFIDHPQTRMQLSRTQVVTRRAGFAAPRRVSRAVVAPKAMFGTAAKGSFFDFEASDQTGDGGPRAAFLAGPTCLALESPGPHVCSPHGLAPHPQVKTIDGQSIKLDKYKGQVSSWVARQEASGRAGSPAGGKI